MFSLVYIYNLTSTISSFAFWFWPFRLCVHINNGCPCSKPGYGFPTSCRGFFYLCSMIWSERWLIALMILVPLVEQELLTLPEHLSSPPVFSGVRVTRSLVLCVCRSLFVLLSFSFGHCVVCSSIYGFWLPLWYLQTLLNFLFIDLKWLILRNLPMAATACVVHYTTHL